MIEWISLIVSFLSSVIGAITGIGGGIIIKPVLDATKTMEVATVSFLSGVTVLSMTGISLIKSRNSSFELHLRISLPLAIGGALGGIAGQALFEKLSEQLANDAVLGSIHAGILVFLLICVALYVALRKRIRTFRITNLGVCLLAGGVLGLISAFLGIGGGPFNVVVLYWLFSMDMKTAAKNSLFIILLAQLFSLITTFVTESMPSFEPLVLVLMIAGGIAGGLTGTSFLKKIRMQDVQKVFVVVLIFMIGINLYNLISFL